MKKLIVTILALAVALSLSVCAFATNDSFDPTLDIEKSADGKTITVTMSELPDGISAELIIPCDGWSGATVKDSTGKTVTSTFGKVDTNPNPEVEQLVDAVTFDAEGGTYTITKRSQSGGYYPVVTPDKTTEEKPAETKPVVTPTTTPSVEETVTPEPEDTTPEVVPDAPPVDEPAVDDAPAVDTEPAGNAGLWIGIGVVALAAIVAVLAIMVARKKRKN